MGKQENIDDIRKWMKELQSERYAIKNALLQELEEYVKQLYVTVLCTVVQYHNEQTEGQMLLLKRIVSGIGVDENVTEYMRKALEINETQMQEFRSMIGDGDIKYYFAIDALLLVALGGGEKDTYEYLAELLELLDISKRDLECLCTVAKAIVMQDGAVYDEAKNMMSEQISGLDLSAYVCSFYTGIIADSEKLVYYHSADENDSDVIELEDSFSAETVIFSNLNLDCVSDVCFYGCSRVLFFNCAVTGESGGSFVFEGCESVEIRSCKFSDFNKPVLREMCVGRVLIENCSFINCVERFSRGYDDWKAQGGVIQFIDSVDININGLNTIVNCSFNKCGTCNEHNYWSYAVISNCNCEVYNCSFRNCWGYCNGGENKDEDTNDRTLFLHDTLNQKNKFVNCANFC